MDAWKGSLLASQLHHPLSSSSANESADSLTTTNATVTATTPTDAIASAYCAQKTPNAGHFKCHGNSRPDFNRSINGKDLHLLRTHH